MKTGTGVVNIDNFTTIPRDSKTSHSLACAIIECYARQSNYEADSPLISDLQTVAANYTDIVYALCQCLRICMATKCFGSGATGDRVFLIIHGHNMSNASILSVHPTRNPEPCGCGEIFEAKNPSILIFKLKSDTSCLVTPLVCS